MEGAEYNRHSRARVAETAKDASRHSSPDAPECIGHRRRCTRHDHRTSAIGVVLSGSASDGTRGLNAIKEKGGITIAQNERSARYSSMPSSAISSGNVDLILTPQGIAQELARLSGHPYVTNQGEPKPSTGGKERILTLLLSATGVDFAQYRQTTFFGAFSGVWS